jgi:hypothetical protein
MTFETDFPSINDYDFRNCLYSVNMEEQDLDVAEVQRIISEGCLDKRRVREAICSMKTRARTVDGELISANDLLKELGL